ncbi:MAG: hypothetical protein E7192_09115 [Erysipelotrichaceae bacterium]|nr:hypothetical protein [Erysipelotrichaceae bacterium]
MKKIIVLILAVMLMGCTSAPGQENPDSSDSPSSGSHGCDVLSPCGDDKADMSVYENFMDSDHVFVSTTMNEAVQAIENKQTFVLYAGFSTCPWCLEAMPILNEVAKEFDASVSYINTRPDHTRESELRKFDNPEYVQFVEAMSEVLSENEEGQKHMYVPFVFFIKEGEIVAWHEDTFPEHDAHERTMSEEEIERLTQIYRQGFETLLK